LQSNVFEFPSSSFWKVDFQLLIDLVIQNERKRPRAERVGIGAAGHKAGVRGKAGAGQRKGDERSGDPSVCQHVGQQQGTVART
jgi:hypothetical protein